ncbi:hypothetical protein ASD64_14440 [Mesorhizobium sp. Root157]|uniref:DUF3828 domain-containing protein n=1 Tax=Mesorhizobium sp. Root157 TaxID=1736477 RepID=UPI0006FEDAFE|nr:DUF3828 domain-containing protein [Mesorhizobium sp. Root157]KQZ99536.1 hypothetical protein ASD64_14440 [Mesorhizobium sp. Root157]
MKLPLLAVTFCLSMSAAAMAGPASDAVKFFYSPGKFVADADYRDRFVEPVTKLFEQNDKAMDSADAIPCIDADPALDAQDFDQGELSRTLKLSEAVSGDSAEVTATFSLFPDGEGAEREMVWSLKKIGGKWKVADIASKTNGWRLSDLECVSGQVE